MHFELAQATKICVSHEMFLLGVSENPFDSLRAERVDVLAFGCMSHILPSALVDLLKEYKIWQDEEKAKWGDKWIDSGKLFTKENGEPIFPETPSQWFNRFVKRHNLPVLTFHQLRHTNASLLIGQGVDVATVSKRLGHANVAITLKTYTHAIKEHDREAADKLGNLLKTKK